MKPSPIVAIFRGETCAIKPRFHRVAPSGTACNQPGWANALRLVYLRLDNAQRIGRPCRHCFPDGVS